MNSNKYQISFHDPEGHVFEVDGRLIRGVSPKVGIRIKNFYSTQLALDLVKENWIPATWALTASEMPANFIENPDRDLVWFEHKKIHFISYAHEWVPEMLLAAAELTLDLAERLHAVGWDLKDASASNVVFNGTAPVFVDICSIIERRQDQPYWRPKGQFERHFILPLMAYIYRNLPPNHIHLSNSDGLNPLEISSLLGFKRWTNILGVKHCAIPVLLSKSIKSKTYNGLEVTDSKVNSIAQQWQLNSIKASLKIIKGKLRPHATNWHTYTRERCHYSSKSIFEKREKVSKWIGAVSPCTVLDLGANTGEFSILASKLATRVIALEKDLDSARLAYNFAKGEGSNIQVVLQDIGNPSPSLGWRNMEKKSLVHRISGEIDCVLALALLHHWLVTAGIPLNEILSSLAQWTKKHLIIEYIPPDDVMFQLLCTQRELNYGWLTKSEFELKVKEFFVIEEIFLLNHGGRILYLLCKKSINN